MRRRTYSGSSHQRSFRSWVLVRPFRVVVLGALMLSTIAGVGASAAADVWGGAGSNLSGVSCMVGGGCAAVGGTLAHNSGGGATWRSLAEGWGGTSWAIETTPTANSPDGLPLLGVSCTQMSTCIAVGEYTNSKSIQVTLAERSNETHRWTVGSTPDPNGKFPFLSAVSCTSPDACIAVGSYLAGRTLPTLTARMLLERLGGTGWRIQTPANPSGAKSSSLSGVSCTAATACTAVGEYVTGTGIEVTLAERWDGSRWTIQTTREPSGAKSGSLTGISCVSGKACTAVGSFTNGAGTPETLAERWNGSSWVLQPTPDPSGATTSSLSAVSCPSTWPCTAVGTYTKPANHSVMLLERFNGTRWVMQTLPSPSAAKSSSLSGVSCTAANACTAVGDYSDSEYDSGAFAFWTLAERWNGTHWRIQTTPSPSGS